MEITPVSTVLPEGTKNGIAPSGSSVKEPHKWHTRFWDNDCHVALRFVSDEELDSVIDWLWTNAELRRLPRVHVGQNTLIVPALAAEVFAKQGFQFSVGKVISAGDFPPEEANRIRSGK